MSAQNVALPFDDWRSIRVKTADTSLFARYDGTGPAVLLLHGCPQHSVRPASFSPFAFAFNWLKRITKLT